MFQKIMFGVLVFFVSLSSNWAVAQSLNIAMLIPGKVDDGGFMQAGYKALLNIEKDFNAKTSYVANIEPKQELMVQALRQLASQQPDMIIAHGGQVGPAVAVVAKEYPSIKFTVVQGNLMMDNVSSYEVLQEHSAWLAGAAAGLMTQSQVVGHISGIRVPPGLKGRGAFADGLRYTNPKAQLLTIFNGNQDNQELAFRTAEAQINAGADIIFTMLNAARPGATEAMRKAGVKHIGNVRDWTQDDPSVYIASAIADVSIPGYLAVKDLHNGQWQGRQLKAIGLEESAAVRLSLSPNVSQSVIDQLNVLQAKIISGEIIVNTQFDGKEFSFVQ